MKIDFADKKIDIFYFVARTPVRFRYPINR